MNAKLNILRGFLFLTTFTAPILADAFDLKIESAVQVSFQAEAGKIYQIEGSLEIQPPIWQVEVDTIRGTGTRHSQTFLTENGIRKIYRIQELNLTNGLVLFFPFNGNASDESGNGNGGLVSGATLGTNRFGIKDNSYFFTATGSCCTWLGDYISTTNSSGFPSGTQDFSVSLWVTLSQFGEDYHVIFANGENNQFQLAIDRFTGADAPITFYTGPGGTSPDLGTAPLNWNLGAWYNLQIVRRANIGTIFRDGVAVAQGTILAGNTASNLKLDFGWRNHPANHPLWGNLDDIRIFNRALSSNELKALREIVE